MMSRRSVESENRSVAPETSDEWFTRGKSQWTVAWKAVDLPSCLSRGCNKYICRAERKRGRTARGELGVGEEEKTWGTSTR
jgi:hypothetical protein